MSIYKRLFAIIAVVLVLSMCILTAFADTEYDIPLLKLQRASGYTEGIANGYNIGGRASEPVLYGHIADFGNIKYAATEWEFYDSSYVIPSWRDRSELKYTIELESTQSPSAGWLGAIFLEPSLVPYIQRVDIQYWIMDSGGGGSLAYLQFSPTELLTYGFLDSGEGYIGLSPSTKYVLNGAAVRNTIDPSWPDLDVDIPFTPGETTALYIPGMVENYFESGNYNRVIVTLILPYYVPNYSLPSGYNLIDYPFEAPVDASGNVIYNASTVLTVAESIVSIEPIGILFTLACFIMLATMLLRFLR